ncbi:hypothetical protein [Thiohalophilus sp.]|uniref:hypothetical protein n=1 Tax=Thiohalophilus sp. TaxID=3028392 RepID=UPI002ACD78E8|nr:hypothetical protein [Thiohalophilus sp.]MDZ7663684.1 hypothetical protein [Thiohalophilus sp.]
MTYFNFIRDRLGSLAVAPLAVLALILAGCSGDEGEISASKRDPAQALFAFYVDGDGQDQLARIDPDTLEVLDIKHVPFNAGGGKQKSYFYEEGYIWTGSGNEVFGFDPDTLEPVEGQTGPFVQGNRSGEVGSALVSSAGTLSGQSTDTNQRIFDKETVSLMQRTSWTEEEMQRYDLCELNHSVTNLSRTLAAGGGEFTALEHMETDEVLFHDMGYRPVGNETAPDGKLVMYGVRQGDHILFLDTDPNSETFGQPVRFVYPRFGYVKDQTNAVVANFSSPYDQAGGTAPGDWRHTRAGNAAPGEDDPETYVEPCDSTMLRDADGVVWTCSPEVDGDAFTCVNVDTITTDTPEVYNTPVPVIRQANFHNDIATAGPWMASLVNRNAGDNELLLFTELEGENAESIWNISDPSAAYEIQRIYDDLSDVADPSGTGGEFVDGSDYTVDIDYSTSGGANTPVTYRYVALDGDDGTGASASGENTAYLAKVDDADPGPNYLLNGLNGRAGTSNGALSRKSGEGSETIIFSDEVWLTTFQGPGTFQIVDLTTSAPYNVETVDIPSAFSGYFSPDGSKYFQTVGGDIEVIDRASRSVVDTISLSGSVSSIAIGTYTSGAAGSIGTGDGDGSDDGGGDGDLLPPNPCGG